MGFSDGNYGGTFDGSVPWASPEDLVFPAVVTGALTDGYSWYRCTIQVNTSTGAYSYVEDYNAQSDSTGTSPAYEINDIDIPDSAFPFSVWMRLSANGPNGAPIYDFAYPLGNPIAVADYGTTDGTYLGALANADGSILFENDTGRLSQDYAGCFFYDPSGRVGSPFEVASFLYIGGSSPDLPYAGGLGLYDITLNSGAGGYQPVYFYNNVLIIGQNLVVPYMGTVTYPNTCMYVGGMLGVGSAPAGDGTTPPGTSYSGTTSGAITFYQPFGDPRAGSFSYSKVLIYLYNYKSTARSWTYTQAFSYTPAVVIDSHSGGVPASVITSLNNSGVTVTSASTAYTGWIFLEGY